MQTRLIKRAVLGAAGAAAVLLAGAAQAALQDRDLNGDTVVDAFYDTDLDITWLRDANVNGPMNWDTAVSWADNYSFGGYDDWRLPTADPSCGVAFNCAGSEMGHLWYVELGNPAGGPMTNTGSFQNLQSGEYWSGTEYAPSPALAWVFRTFSGSQGRIFKYNLEYALAVRPGDVVAVPEPTTYVLMLAGLTALAAVARRRPR